MAGAGFAVAPALRRGEHEGLRGPPVLDGHVEEGKRPAKDLDRRDGVQGVVLAPPEDAPDPEPAHDCGES